MASLWKRYKALINHPMGNYAQADMIAQLRAIDFIRTLDPNETISFEAWAKDAVEYAVSLTGYGKYRDICPILMSFGEKYDLVKFSFNGKQPTPQEIDNFSNWKDIQVKVTAKGLLVEYDEFFKEEDLLEDERFLSKLGE